MFRHSQPLLFRSMPGLNQFKIHHPLPLSPRESRKLLNLLTTSFRNQLDKAHGFRTDIDSKVILHSHPQKAGQERRRSYSDSDTRRPTDLHLISVLTNPLFKVVPASSTPGNDSMSIFERGVSRGLMNTYYAMRCLRAKKNDIIRSPVLTIRQGMKESGAALKVLKWLSASGRTESNDFLCDVNFAQILMQFMVAEELQEASWKWIKRAFEDLPRLLTLSGKERTRARQDMVRPLLSLIKAEAMSTDNLDSAYLCLSRAAGYLKGLTKAEMIVVLGPPGTFLSHITSSLKSNHLPPSESAFDSFLSLVPVISTDTEYHVAQLSLRHPTCPSGDAALAYLQKMESSPVNHSNLSNSPKAQDIITMGLSTGRFLLDNGRSEDAEWVIEYLQTQFAHELGVEREAAIDRAKAEASSLDLLESLSLA